MTDAPPEVSILVQTFRRPRLLRLCLESCLALRLPDGVTVELLVVDNSPEQEGRAVVEALTAEAEALPFPLRYSCEPTPGIAAGRNHGVAETRGAWLAVLDDDEVADPGWLAALVEARDRFQADLVFGPAIPAFEGGAPPACDPTGHLYGTQPDHATGAPVEHGSTANVLMRRAAVPGPGPWFDPSFALAGGEDTMLFLRISRTGARMIWCNEAVTHEFITCARQQPGYLLRRAFRYGQTTVLVRSAISSWPRLTAWWWRAKGLVQALLHLPLAWIPTPFGMHHRYKVCLGVGKLLAFRSLRYEIYKGATYTGDAS